MYRIQNVGCICTQTVKGYYIYVKGSKPKPDPSVLSIVEESRKVTYIMHGGKLTKRSVVEAFPDMEGCISQIRHQGEDIAADSVFVNVSCVGDEKPKISLFFQKKL